MNKDELAKAEAFKLITAIVDDEASEQERTTFFNYIIKDDDIRRKYESIKSLKSLIKHRCPRARAPQSLRNRVKKYIRNPGDSDQQTGTDAPIFDIPTGGPSHSIAVDGQSSLSNPTVFSSKR